MAWKNIVSLQYNFVIKDYFLSKCKKNLPHILMLPLPRPAFVGFSLYLPVQFFSVARFPLGYDVDIH